MEKRQRKDLIIVILMMLISNVLFGQRQTYRLSVIDSTSFSDFNIYYFEFKKGRKTYKVIYNKGTYKITNSNCLLALKVKNYYNIKLNQTAYVPINDSITGDVEYYFFLSKVQFIKGKRHFGGFGNLVYLSRDIFKGQINCDCLVEEEKKKKRQ
jgi:hypothetical protein